MPKTLEVRDHGTVAYGDALELQRDLARARIDGTVSDDILLLVEHPPVITFGRTAKAEHLTAGDALLRSRGVEVFDIERGGDVTFHGPGQLVGYPIFDLSQHRQDLHWYLRQLEEALIVALRHLDIAARRRDSYTGVWTEDGTRKIASIGVHVKQWVTWHGFALNVTTDLSYFDLLVPCGIADVVMTSVERELGSDQPAETLWERTVSAVVKGFEEVFEMEAGEYRISNKEC